MTGRDLELEVVKTAFYLENNLKELKQEQRKLYEPREPIKPELQDVQPNKPNYPIITPPEKFDNDIKFLKSKAFRKTGIISIIMIVGAAAIGFVWTEIFGIGLLVYTIFKFFSEQGALRNIEKEKYINNIKNTEDYKKTCKQIDEQCKADYEQRKNAAQQEYDRQLIQYKEAKRKYDEELLPDYLAEENSLSSAIEASESALRELYENHKIIPAQYHNVSALAWIALYMHTSQYTLKDAIERWDEHVARCQRNRLIELSEAQLYVLEEQLRYQENTNWLNAQLVELSEKSNDILSSIGIWQKACMLVNEYRYQKQKKQNRLNQNTRS